MPFHWISQWTGGFFEDISLTKIGLEIHLGHQGKPCPEVTDDWYDTDDEGDNFAEGQWVPLVNDPQTTTVVDTSGLHSLMIRFCWCASALGPDMQLFEIGLFPASFTSPKTVFTFAVLDNFLLDNLELYSLHLVPDRYRELMRVGRQWRQLKQLKWHGFSHEKQKPKAGELALFCPACPQPGVNINLAERNVSNPAWLYLRSLVMDGNFKAEHMFPANPTNEVALTDGLGFMTATTTEQSIRRTLHVTSLKQLGLAVVHALDMGVLYLIQWWTFKRGKDEHGLCAVSSSGVQHLMGSTWALTFYDINCQYHKHLDQQVEESPYLDLPWGMEIGKFLCRKFKEAVQGVRDSQHAFDQLSETADDDTLVKWEAEAAAAQDDRLENPSAMDIYDVKMTKGDQLDEYDKLDLMTMMLDAAELDSAASSSDDPDWPDNEDRYDTPVKFTPEALVIPLPSNIGIERCAEWGVANLVLQEISLREGQANDALHAIRVNLADKAVLFRTTVRSAKSQAWSTRAWARVHLVDKILHLNVQMYSKCRSQLVHLGADDLLVQALAIGEGRPKGYYGGGRPKCSRSKE
ncbi:hypothetical protein F4604DRAFT_1937648 [Suillus subluteus]|nr:hypothetical protein F4604DRAFT_1937648 [Suillus subluteus]